MRTSKWLSRTLLHGVGAAMLAATTQAQIVVGTGVLQTSGLDNRWQVSTNGGTSFSSAFVVTSPPGVWGSSAPGGIWVGATSSGSGGGGSYRIRQQFTLNSGDLLSFSLRCAYDNFNGQIWVNNVLFGTGVCGTSSFNWSSFQGFLQSDFVTGLNSIEMRWTGDDITDGAAVEIANLRYTPGNANVVPEPATYVMMVSGLAGLALIRRRRQV
jgi:PEP-CTERM motif